MFKLICLFCTLQDDSNLEQAVKNRKVPTPYLLVIGTVQDNEQIFLITDCRVITEVSHDECVLLLLSSYFVYNICYPKGCKSLFSFLEYTFLDTCLDKLSPLVKQFLANIDSHSL